ncbi:uncharacterized protein LOC18436431 isoform X3 [Amborella trichopoda]|uniref:uncharacterized protein LOC18436431 isoform X3 n=1 Tax=Amborella trichopoda TaxID=13333 RepID=UPI0009BEEE6D|nr:uncharacterized protein LOC18436431 isoform X3 [Amborella trichopoda]|eukprot:XP_020524174.1 uncharacterized protein LOC18436431 isoform X3 [Amborella trichopoda]
MVLFKNRYLVMEVFLDPNRELAGDETIILTQFNVSKAIKDSIHLNFGECGLAAAIGSFQVKYVNPITKVCIIRVARQDYQKIWCAITMVRNIGNCPVIFNLLNLSGCIRACKREALKCDEAKFELYKLTVGDNLSPQVLQQKCEQRPRFQPHPICFMGKCPALLRLSMEDFPHFSLSHFAGKNHNNLSISLEPWISARRLKLSSGPWFFMWRNIPWCKVVFLEFCCKLPKILEHHTVYCPHLSTHIKTMNPSLHSKVLLPQQEIPKLS